MRLANLAGAVLFMSCCGWASLVENPSFETPNLTGGIMYRPTVPNVDWTFTGSAGVTAAAGAGTGFNLASVPYGNQAGFIQKTGTIDQTLAGLDTTNTYMISFFSATRPDIGMAPLFYGGGEDFDIYWDDTLIGTYLPTLTTFSYYTTLEFQPTSSTGVLSFRGLDSNTDCGSATPCDRTAFIDNVEITDTSISPEPSSAVLIFTGVALIGFGIRRKLAGVGSVSR